MLHPKKKKQASCCLIPDWCLNEHHVPANRRWTSLCFELDKQMVVFMTKTLFGFCLAMFCFASLCYEMLQDVPNPEFTTMHFSLISFVAGYFLGSSPRLASVQPNNIGLLTDPGGDGLDDDVDTEMGYASDAESQV